MRRIEDLQMQLAIARSAGKFAEAERIQNQLHALQVPDAVFAEDGKEAAEDASLRLAKELQLEERDRLAAEQLQQEDKLARARTEADKLTQKLLDLELAREWEEKDQQEAASLALIATIQAQEHEALMAAQDIFRVVNGQFLVDDPRPISKNIAVCREYLADKTFQALLTTPAVVGEPIQRDKKGNPIYTDAHKFTRTHIRTGIPTLVKIDDALKLSDPNIPVKTVLKEVLEFVATMPEKERPNVANIKTSLDLIPGDNYVEGGETGAHVPQLLSRIWSLSKLYGNAEKGLVALILHLNIADKGQCMPGLVARLYPPLALMLNDILNRSAEAALYADMGPAFAGDIGPGAAARREEGEWQKYDPAQFEAPRPAPVAGPGAVAAVRLPVAAVPAPALAPAPAVPAPEPTPAPAAPASSPANTKKPRRFG